MENVYLTEANKQFMKPETGFRARSRSIKRKARVLVFHDTTGKRFVVVRSSNGELTLPTQVASFSRSSVVGLSSDTHEQASFPVYSFSDIRQAGGIDALSEAIGNNQSIKAPLIDFSEEEWKGMIRDLGSDK